MNQETYNIIIFFIFIGIIGLELYSDYNTFKERDICFDNFIKEWNNVEDNFGKLLDNQQAFDKLSQKDVIFSNYINCIHYNNSTLMNFNESNNNGRNEK